MDHKRHIIEFLFLFFALKIWKKTSYNCFTREI